MPQGNAISAGVKHGDCATLELVDLHQFGQTLAVDGVTFSVGALGSEVFGLFGPDQMHHWRSVPVVFKTLA